MRRQDNDSDEKSHIREEESGKVGKTKMTTTREKMKMIVFFTSRWSEDQVPSFFYT